MAVKIPNTAFGNLSLISVETVFYSRLVFDILLLRWLFQAFNRLYLQDENEGFKFLRTIDDHHKTTQYLRSLQSNG
jgi:hypothetical protein